MASAMPIIAQKGTLPDDILHNNENGLLVDGVDDLAEKISVAKDSIDINEV